MVEGAIIWSKFMVTNVQKMVDLQAKSVNFTDLPSLKAYLRRKTPLFNSCTYTYTYIYPIKRKSLVV